MPKIEFLGWGVMGRKSFTFGEKERLNSTLRLPPTSLLWERKRGTWYKLGCLLWALNFDRCFGILHFFLWAHLWLHTVTALGDIPWSSDSSSVGMKTSTPIWAFSDTTLEEGLRCLITAQQQCRSRYPTWPLLLRVGLGGSTDFFYLWYFLWVYRCF